MIKWITDNLGTGSFEKVIKESGIKIVDTRDLVDREGNLPEAIQSKIDVALEYINQGEKVVVCCDYGMSRSNAIAVGVLAKLNRFSFAKALKKIITITGEKSINIQVLNAVHDLHKKSEKGAAQEREKRILITGSGGFIGKSLIDALQGSEFEIYAPQRDEVDLMHDTAVLDLKIKEKSIGQVIHLANPRIYSTSQSMGSSVVMLKNVLDVCASNNLQLTYLSSWEIYSGYQTDALRANEKLTPWPGSNFGQTKTLCENLINFFQNQFGLSCLILRSSPVYGIQNDRPKFLWNFLNKAIKNQEIVTHEYLNGFPALDLIHIRDLIKAMILSLNININGRINIGTGKASSTAWIAEWIIKELGSSSTIRHQQINKNTGNIVMDISLARHLLGWEPVVDIKEGLKEIIELEKDSVYA